MPMQRPFSVPESEYPFESHWFDYRGSALHYLDEGEGLPVLLLHGNPTWSFLYRKVIPGLGSRCRAIAPDYPGFGFSAHPPDYGYTPKEHAEAVIALIDHLDLREFVIVGQDWGGPIGIAVAQALSRSVKGLVVCNTWCWRADVPMMRLFSRAMGGALGRYLILRHNFFADRLMKGALRQSGASEASPWRTG
jgi:haloalkane dehalogenase